MSASGLAEAGPPGVPWVPVSGLGIAGVAGQPGLAKEVPGVFGNAAAFEPSCADGNDGNGVGAAAC